MSLLLQCPHCSAQIEIADSAAPTTCPQCSKPFDTGIREGEAPARASRRKAQAAAPEEEDAEPGRVNPWGAAGLIFATLGILAATVVGNRMATYTFLGLGLVAVIVGIGWTALRRKPMNVSWLAIGGAVNVAALGMVLFAPGLLNRYWTMDGAVPVPDPHKLVAAPRDNPRGEGRALAPDDWVDAVTELIRQDDAQIRINAVALGPVPDKPGQTFLLVNIRLANVRNDKVVFEGFAKTKHPPVLKDGSGKSFACLEQRQRKPAAGAVVFIAAEPQTIAVGQGGQFDLQLVFEAPPADFSTLKLELPASAYGRKGVCKFAIPELFVAPIPEVTKK